VIDEARSVSARFLQTQSDGRLLKLAGQGHERAFRGARAALPQVAARVLPALAAARRAGRRTRCSSRCWPRGWRFQRGIEIRDAKPWLYRIVHNTALNMLRSSSYDYAQLHDSLRGVESARVRSRSAG